MPLFDRVIKLNTSTIEQEAEKLKKKCKKIGLYVRVVYSQTESVRQYFI